MWGLLFILLLYSLVFGLAEWLYRRDTPAHLTRKLTHIGGALVSAALPWTVSLPTAVLLGLFFC